jgi:hypothetical protein
MIMEYKHTQYNMAIIFAAIISLFWISKNFILVDIRPIVFVIFSVLFLCLFIFFSLTVEIKNGFIECVFGPGIVKQKIKLSDVLDAHTVKNPWYDGWGIRWIPGKYVVWNVSGFDAVEIQLSGFKKFRIGTNEPDKLLEAIRENI